MSKKSRNHNIQQMKEIIRDQANEIVYLTRANKHMQLHVNSMQKGNQQHFLGVMNCVYAHCANDIITEKQAGSLLLSLVGIWHHP